MLRVRKTLEPHGLTHLRISLPGFLLFVYYCEPEQWTLARRLGILHTAVPEWGGQAPWQGLGGVSRVQSGGLGL